MALSDALKRAVSRATETKAVRGKRRNAVFRATAVRAGVACCANCGRPMVDAKAIVQRERRLIEQTLKENDAFRRALAADIYETFSQRLVGALLYLQGFEHLQRENSPQAEEAFRKAMESLRDTLADSRRIANELKSSAFDGANGALSYRRKIPSFYRS